MAIRVFLIVIAAAISAGVAYVLNQQFTYDLAVAGAAGVGVFVFIYAFLSSFDMQRVEGKAVQAQSDASAISKSVKRAIAKQKKQIERLEGDDRNQELLAEVKVLQTLLAQVAAERTRPSKSATMATTDKTLVRGQQDAAQELDEEVVAKIVHNALKENRLDLYVQPIVSLPARQHVHYECYSRVRDENGETIFARDYMPQAEKSGVTGTLDNLLLFRLIQLVRKLGHRRPGVKFFCNISSSSLHDKEFFPQFVEYMLSNDLLADRLIFEFAQADVMNMSETVERNLLALGQKGFRYSMDNVESTDVGAAGLSQRFFRYLKMDGDKLMQQGVSPLSFKEELAKYDIDLIVSKVEDEEMLIDILEKSIDFGQGYLFGEPKLNTHAGEANTSEST